MRDSGVGIASWVKERMFEPFFSTKETGKGSGMGLAMVHGIVHGHGGHLLVESSLGQGANFRLLLPAAGGEVAAQAPAARSAAERPRLAGRVLVVDDEPVIREFMAELFEGWGLETVLAADGEEARSAFAADPQGFDLVLTDQTMPRLTGLELARELLRMRPGLPVILCTGYGEDLPPDAVGAAGLCAIASKPVDVAHILSLFRAHLPGV
ncbi:MAG: response regulator [Betaproteobacteria bacterium]|nr:response regulator [Betaproteobacteria bacterium]